MDFFFWAFCFAGTCWVQFAFGSWAQDSILLMGLICSIFFFLFPMFALSAASFLFGNLLLSRLLVSRLLYSLRTILYAMVLLS